MRTRVKKKVLINKSRQSITSKYNKNSKCKLCGNRDKTANHESEGSKQVLKGYKNWHDCGWGVEEKESDPLGMVQETEFPP